MIWNFFKTNWFSIALVILLLAAIARGSGKFSLQNYFSSESQPLDESHLVPKSATTLGIGAAPSNRRSSPLAVDQGAAAEFLKRFSVVAVSERKKFGVPASVLLATAFLNSQAGLNNAALEANSFFAIRCSNDWEGLTLAVEDHCLRRYETPWASWRDFSIYLSSQEWFGSLRRSAGKDWRKWSSGLNDKQISRVANFGQKMAEVIEYYHLYELDQQ
jgi:hypothetical protein